MNENENGKSVFNELSYSDFRDGVKIDPDSIKENLNVIDSETIESIVEPEKSLSEIHAKEQAEKEEKAREEQKIKKAKVPGQLDHSHPLMTCEMNLLEISHRTIEIVEKYKLNLIGSSEGSYEDDVKKFKDFLFDTLVKLKK